MIDLFQRASTGLFARRRPADLQIGRLRLVAITPEMLAAEQNANTRELAQLLNASITTQWPPEHWEPHVLRFIERQYEERPETVGWHRYVLLTGWGGWDRTLVGCFGAFPKTLSEVEIGYSTLPEFQRRGFATAAARVMVDWLLRCEGVRSVTAQTYTRLPESIKVMERCGMTYAGDGDELGTVRYRRRG